jgi:hypothetical protein
MEHEPSPPNRFRENVVILTLVLVLGGVIVFFLDLISFGIFTYAIAVGGAVVLLGFVHYLAWGRAMTEEVAAEREAMLLKEEKEAEDREHPEGIQDLTRTRGIKRGRPK